MKNTIYNEEVWERIIEKHNLKEEAIKLGIFKNPERAEEMMKDFHHNFGDGRLNEEERNFCTKLAAVEFTEQRFLSKLVSTGREHYSVGANDYAIAAMDLILLDFDSSFKDFISECKKRQKDIHNIKFAEAYEIFLYVIKLKMEYQIPYTKLFVRRLLQLSPESFRQEKLSEINQYFLVENPNMLIEIQEELIN